MSNHSRIRREAKKRNTAKAGAGEADDGLIEPHAELRDQQGKLLAGIVRREGEWVLGMDGRIAGSTHSAAHVLAMIRRAAVLHEAQGTPVRLTWSDALKGAAHAEAAERGLTFEEFEARLGQSMAAAKTRENDAS